jgi:hypothetical protein
MNVLKPRIYNSAELPQQSARSMYQKLNLNQTVRETKTFFVAVIGMLSSNVAMSMTVD